MQDELALGELYRVLRMSVRQMQAFESGIMIVVVKLGGRRVCNVSILISAYNHAGISLTDQNDHAEHWRKPGVEPSFNTD